MDWAGGAAPVITVAEYVARVRAEARPLTPEAVNTAEAAGRTLAEAAHARLDIPAFDNSAMDGFAVRFADVADAAAETPVRLAVTADIPAGSAENPPVAPGTAVRIMTGAPIPSEADTIVPFEATRGGLADSLTVAEVLAAPAAAGAHVRRRAVDIAAGDEVLPAGTVLGPEQIAALVAAGIPNVQVTRAPRVLVVSTGAELVAPGVVPGAGQIPDSNSTLLALLAEAAGAVVVTQTHVDDDPASLTALLADATEVDVVITSGGVSAGAFEPVKQALDGAVAFEKVAMQPGKPQAFGRLSTGALFFGLPGNPVSVAVSFEVIARPVLLAMQGRAVTERPRMQLTAGTEWRTPPGREQYLPIVVERPASDPAHWRVHPATAGGSGSHLAGGLGRAQGYAIVPAEVETVHVGDRVDVMLVS